MASFEMNHTLWITSKFLTLFRGSFVVKEMEAIKIISSQRRNGGMSALARKSRIQVDDFIEEE
jgi:hypothetical protein